MIFNRISTSSIVLQYHGYINLLERSIHLFFFCYEKDKVTLVTNRKHKVCNHEAQLNVLHIVAKRNNESIQDFLKKSLALDRKFYCYTKNIHLTHISMCLKSYLAKCNFLAFFVNMQKRLKCKITKVNLHRLLIMENFHIWYRKSLEDLL